MEFKRPLCLFFVLFTLLSISQANKFYVGGSDGWVPNPSQSYNQWAGKNRFQVNDTIVFKYKKGSDSVLEVKKEDYDKCNKTNPIKKFEEGDTEFKLDRAGPFYFISGKDGNCEKGQKLVVVVLSPRKQTAPPSPSVPTPTSPPKSSPSPSPSVPSPTSPPKSSPSPSPSPSGSPKTSPSPSVSPSPAAHPPSPASSPVPAGGPPASSPAPTGKSPSPSPTSTPPAGGPPAPSPGTSPAPGPTSPSPTGSPPAGGPPAPSPGTPPTGSPPTGGPPAPSPGTPPTGSPPTGGPPAPGASPPSSNATAPPQGNSGSSVAPSSFLVYSVTVLVGAALLRYKTILG